MTGRERVQARKQAARKERIRQAQAVKRAKPGGLAGMGVSMGDMTKQALDPDGGLEKTIMARLADNPERADVAAWAGEAKETPDEP